MRRTRLAGLAPCSLLRSILSVGLLHRRLVVKTTAARLMNSGSMLMREKDSQQIEQGIFQCHLPKMWLTCHEKPIGHTWFGSWVGTDTAGTDHKPCHPGAIGLPLGPNYQNRSVNREEDRRQSIKWKTAPRHSFITTGTIWTPDSGAASHQGASVIQSQMQQPASILSLLISRSVGKRLAS